MINVIVADDQKTARKGIKMLLSLCDEINVIGEAENGRDLLLLLEKKSPHVILMDVRMPIMNGIEATKIIKERYPNIKVIILTTFTDDEYIFNLIKHGIDGYILKDAGAESIIKAIKLAYNGSMMLDPQITAKVVKAFNSIPDEFKNSLSESSSLNNKFNLLTPREIDVSDLIAKGKSNKDICKILFLTEGTVKNYVTRILGKLQLNNRTELAVFLNNLKKDTL